MVKRNADGADRSEGGGIGQAGWYHFMVEEAEETETNAKLVCSVATGDHPEEKGKKYTHFVNFFASDPNDEQKQSVVTRMMFDWCEALMLEEKITKRIFTPAVREEMVKAKADVEFDFSEAMGRQFVAKVVLEPYKGKDAEKKAQYAGRMFPRIAYDVFHPLHEKVKNVPKDPDLMSVFGGGASGGGAGGNGNGNESGNGAKPKPTPPDEPAAAAATAAGPAAAAASSDPWGGF